MTILLQRETFRTSREMDFFSEKELVTQTGHQRAEWPLVFLKETIDNALDGCEDGDIAPTVKVLADECGITVQDNGVGIPEETLAGALDFTVRASNREMYVAPDRGAQGNALKTLLAMPYVMDPDGGRLIIIAHGVRHEIACRADPISQRAIVDDNKTRAKKQPGTTIRIEWSRPTNDATDDVLWPVGDVGVDPIEKGDTWHPSLRDHALQLLRGYTLFNPHLSLTVEWFGEVVIWTKATDPKWKKWRPNQPTNALWYEPRHLERLIAAYITLDRDRGRKSRTISDFLTLFDGLSGSSKRKHILDETGLSRVTLEDLATVDGVNMEAVAKLLAAMKAHSKEVKPSRLGIIGKEHLATRFEELGCDPKQFEYSKIARVDDGIPFVLESAFSWRGDDADNRRSIFAGANWSSAIRNPFRSFGQTGVGLETQLSELNAGPREPIVFMLHLAHPRVEYTDRGKSAIVIDSDGAEANDMVEEN